MEQSKESRALLSAAQSIAIAEGISDDELMVTRINEIYQDACLEEPKTDEGKQALEKAKFILENAMVESPYKTKFNYDKYQDETVLPAIVAIFKLYPLYIEDMINIAKAEQTTPEEKKLAYEAVEKLSIDSFKVLNEFKVTMPKYKHLFAKMKEMIAFLEDIQVEQMTGHRYEVLSRIFKAENPGTGQYDGNYALYSDLIAARDQLKSDTDGPNGEDRFALKKDTAIEDFN